jgi:hypothetical protein
MGLVLRLLSRSHRLEHHDGTAETFERARVDFEAAWREYLPGCTLRRTSAPARLTRSTKISM